MMGLILLIGLIVKNGIILLDCADIVAARGADRIAALVQAGAVRLRPILMTTLCTLFGLAPLALGLGPGAEMQKPSGDRGHRRTDRLDDHHAVCSYRRPGGRSAQATGGGRGAR